MSYGMTNRQKREQLDQKLRRECRYCDEAEIVERRERYLEAHYGTSLHRKLPLPEQRHLPRRPEPLTMKDLEREIRSQHSPVSTILGTGLGFLFCLFMGGLITLAGIHTGSVLCILIGLAFLCFGILLIRYLPDTLRKGKIAVSMVKSGQIEIRGYRVLDMSHQDESSATDDNADWHYYLHLEKSGQQEPWYYDCGRENYDTIREGDTVYLVFCKGQDTPFFLFLEKFRTPDPQLRFYMRMYAPSSGA